MDLTCHDMSRLRNDEWQEKCAMHLQEQQILSPELHTRLANAIPVAVEHVLLPSTCHAHGMCWDVPQDPLMLYAHQEISNAYSCQGKFFHSHMISFCQQDYIKGLMFWCCLEEHAQFLGMKLDPMVQDQFVCFMIPLYENTWEMKYNMCIFAKTYNKKNIIWN